MCILLEVELQVVLGQQEACSNCSEAVDHTVVEVDSQLVGEDIHSYLGAPQVQADNPD